MKAFHNYKQQMIGFIDEGIFYKKVQGSKHTFKMFNAFGIEEKALEEMKDECTQIRIKDIENGAVYSTSYSTFMEKGIKKNFDTPQVFLPIKYFHYEPALQKSLL